MGGRGAVPGVWCRAGADAGMISVAVCHFGLPTIDVAVPTDSSFCDELSSTPKEILPLHHSCKCLDSRLVVVWWGWSFLVQMTYAVQLQTIRARHTSSIIQQPADGFEWWTEMPSYDKRWQIIVLAMIQNARQANQVGSTQTRFSIQHTFCNKFFLLACFGLLKINLHIFSKGKKRKEKPACLSMLHTCIYLTATCVVRRDSHIASSLLLAAYNSAPVFRHQKLLGGKVWDQLELCAQLPSGRNRSPKIGWCRCFNI